MDLLYLLKENFKNLLFDLLIIGRSLVKKYQVSPPNIFYGLEAYGTQWEVAPLVISESMSAFSTVQLDVAKNHIN